VPRIIKILQLNSQFKLFEQLANNALYYYLPFLLRFEGMILIFSNFACVKFHSIMPIPVFLSMPVLSIFVVIIILTLFPAATKVFKLWASLLNIVLLTRQQCPASRANSSSSSFNWSSFQVNQKGFLNECLVKRLTASLNFFIQNSFDIRVILITSHHF